MRERGGGYLLLNGRALKEEVQEVEHELIKDFNQAIQSFSRPDQTNFNPTTHPLFRIQTQKTSAL
jgi:hypothetical protein